MEVLWNDEKVSKDEVRVWVKSVTSATNIRGPEEIFRSNDWGITAKFYADEKEVVCKIGFLPIFHTSPIIYQLLNGLSIENVPALITAEKKGQQTWMLFETFHGTALKDNLSLHRIKETAKTIASIQNEVAKHLNNSSDYSIPKIEVCELQKVCFDFLNLLEENYAPIWNTETSKIAKNFQISEENIEMLGKCETYVAMKESVNLICDKLSEKSIPLSLFHLDLHTGNVVTLQNGNQLIYDWEEAIITLPFFTLNKLLPEAANFEDEENNGNSQHLINWTSSESAVIATYLKELKMDVEEGEVIFDLAMGLAPLIYAKQSLQFIEQVGWKDEAAGFLAYDVIVSLNRMQQLKSKGEV
jgi:thiamine kinase-like enzyme